MEEASKMGQTSHCPVDPTSVKGRREGSRSGQGTLQLRCRSDSLSQHKRELGAKITCEKSLELSRNSQALEVLLYSIISLELSRKSQTFVQRLWWL